MKKARILFILCLVAALTIGMALSASAEETTPIMIEYISITMELPYVGDSVDVEITDFTATAYGNGAALPADAISMTLSYPYSGGTFGENEHMLSCQITVSEGYKLAEGVMADINESGNLTTLTPAADGMSYSGRDLTFCPRQPEYTDLIVETLPVPTPGAAIAPYSYTPEGNQYTVTGTWYVYDYQTQTAAPATGTFENGKLYQLHLTATAAAGWQFHRSYLHVLTEDRDFRSNTFNSREMTFVVTIPCGEMERVEDVYITGIPTEITAGQTAGALTLTTQSKANLSAQWLDAEGNVFTGTFEAGKVYYLSVTVTPQSGAYLYERLWIYDEYHNYLGSNTTNGISTTVNIRYSLIPKVDKVEISGITDAVIGQAPTTEGIKVPEGAGYTLETASLAWALIGEGDGEEWTVFEDHNAYVLQICVLLSEGYEWGEDLEVTANGVPVEDWYRDETEDGKPCIWINLKYSFREIINKVEISGVTDAVIGQAPTTEGIKVPDGAHYTLDTERNHWEQEGEYEEWTVFAEGKKYILYLYVNVAEGYEFTEDTVLTVNGEEVDCWNIGETWLYVGLEYSFLKQIDKVDITVPTPEIGQTATLEGIVLPEGLVLNEDESFWFENVTVQGENGNEGRREPVTGAFQKGHKYYLSLSFDVKDGYELADDAELYCNGNLADGDNETYGYLWEASGYLETMYSFRDIINKVEITGVNAPVVGQTATTESIQITGVGEYEIYWADEDSEAEEPFTGTFQTGKAYILYIDFDSAEGTEFGDNCIVTVNGEEMEDIWLSNEGGNVELRYTFKTVIDKVEITGMPQFSVGGTASASSLKAPEGANYTVIGQWGDMTGDDGDSFTGTFQTDGVYALHIAAVPKDGYELAEDLQFLIDGKEPATLTVVRFTDYALAVYYYAPSYKDIGKVELTVKDPVIGQTYKSDYIETAEDAKYSLYGEWFVSEDGETWKRTSTGTFEEGKHYRMMLYVELRNGEQIEYWFGNQAQVSVNGVDVVWDGDENYASPTSARIMMDYGALCSHSYGNWTSVDGKNHAKTCTKCGDVVTEGHEWHSEGDVKCPACGYDRSDNPPTGDAVVPAALLALCSVTALVVIRKRRSVR